MTSSSPAVLSAGALRRVVVGATLALMFEAALYSAVAPLLPHYVDEFDLSTASAGFLTASYTFGMLIGSVSSGALADRIGPRLTVFIGLIALGITTMAFGIAANIYLLDGARLAQGFSSGMIWAGVMTWLITSAPEDRRGQAIGGAFAGAVIGTLLGPVIGTVAVEVGDEITFGFVGLVAIGLGLRVIRLPQAAAQAAVTQARFRKVISDRRFLVVFALATIPGLLAGMINVLIPLRLHDAGAASALVGAMFVVMGLAMAALSPLAGRRADVIGERLVMLAGLAIAAAALFALGFLEEKWSIAVVTVLLGGCGLALFSVPGVSLLTRVSEVAGMTAGATAAVTNIAFSGGETAGAALSAVTAEATSDTVPMLGLAAICFTALLTVAFSRHLPRGAANQTALERTS